MPRAFLEQPGLSGTSFAFLLEMMTNITLADLTVLFFAIVFCLGIALVWLFCELERRFAPQIAALTGTSRRQSRPDLDMRS